MRPVRSEPTPLLDPSIKTHADYVARIKETHLAQFDEPQRARYDSRLHSANERDVKTSDMYRVHLARIIGKNSPPNIEAMNIRDMESKHRNGALFVTFVEDHNRGIKVEP